MPDARRAPDPAAPSVLGRYHVLGELGRDRIYITHLARLEGPSGFQRWAMVRRVRPEVAEVPGFHEAFYDAARASGRIDHPNVVVTHDVGEEDGHLWTALEYVQGELVQEILDRTQRARSTVAWSIACKIISDAALGVDGIHSSRDASGQRMGLIHGHISPKSLIVAYAGKTKVLDPCAPVIPTDVEASITVSDEQSEVLPYLAPEQVWGEPVDARADVFSLGVILWELCAGRPLFRGKTEDETRALLEAVSVPELRNRVKGLPGAIDSLLRRAISRDPKKRFDTARDFARTLQEVMVSQGVSLDEEEVGRYMGRVFAERLEEREKLLRQAADVTEVFRRGDLKFKPKPSARPPAPTSAPELPPITRRQPTVPPPAAFRPPTPGRAQKPVPLPSRPPPPDPAASGLAPPRRPSRAPPPQAPPQAPDTVRDMGDMSSAVSSSSDEQPTMVMSEQALLREGPVVSSDSDDEGVATTIKPLDSPEYEDAEIARPLPMRHAPSVEIAPEVLAMPPMPPPMFVPMPPSFLPPLPQLPPGMPPQSLAATVLVTPRGRAIRTVEIIAVVAGLGALTMVVLHWLGPFLHPPGTDDGKPTPTASVVAPPASTLAPSAPSAVRPTASSTAVAPVPSASAVTPPVATPPTTASTAKPAPPAPVATPPAAAATTAAPAATHHRRAPDTEDKPSTPSPTIPSGAGTGLLTVICIPACDQVLDGSTSLGGSPVYKVQVRAGAHKLTLRTSDPPMEKSVDTTVKADDITLVKVNMSQ